MNMNTNMSGPSGGAGGTAGGGMTTGANQGGDGGTPQHVVGNCDSLGKVGAWEQINPPVDFAKGNGAFGTNAFVVDPVHSGTVYLGTSGLGIWKTTDCGATWTHVNTGANSPQQCGASTDKSCAQLLDTGRQWSFAIDPQDPDVLYANNGYGSGSYGMMKSTNGGVDWQVIWPPADAMQAKISGFPNQLTIDPYDHHHLLLDFHDGCAAPMNSLCFGDSKDAGQTWTMINGDPKMGSAHESRMAFLENSNTWAFAAGSIWRTTDGGASFKQVSSEPVGGFLYHAKDGSFFFSGESGVVTSMDGITWTLIPHSGTTVKGLIGDGTNIYASSFSPCYADGTNLQPYASSPETGPSTFTPIPSPGMNQGGYFLGIDLDHHVLYSSNCADGFWRMVTP